MGFTTSWAERKKTNKWASRLAGPKERKLINGLYDLMGLKKKLTNGLHD